MIKIKPLINISRKSSAEQWLLKITPAALINAKVDGVDDNEEEEEEGADQNRGRMMKIGRRKAFKMQMMKEKRMM